MLKEIPTKQIKQKAVSNKNGFALNENGSGKESFNTIVIGGGQAGLATGYYLTKYGIDHVILDAAEKTGDSWRKRWDSLRLFTPACLDSLPGMPFPAPDYYFPTKDEMADYLSAYAEKFNLPMRNGFKVEKLSKIDDHFVVEAAGKKFTAKNVVVAMAHYQKSKVPEFAKDLDEDIQQIHSSEYKNPGQLKKGNVLLVGAGNSGAEIAMELVSHHEVFLSGKDTGNLPFNIHGLAARLFLIKLVLRVIFHRILTVKTPMGRKMRTKLLSHGGPLIRTRPNDLLRNGVERVSRVAGVRDGKPILEDNRVLNVANIIWCTGYHHGFSWINLPIFDEVKINPLHYRGIAANVPGLFFTGLPFLYAASSSMIHGVARDAKYIVGKIASRNGNKKWLKILKPQSRFAQPDLI